MSVQRTPALLCLFHALQMSLFPMAVITVFWQREIGMSMLQIMALQGCFGLAMALFEFPSGYLADRLGYRRTLMVASVLLAGAWGIYSFATSFAQILVAEVFLGAGSSLVSGTDDALLYETICATRREHEFSRWTGRMRFWGQTGEGSAALCAGLLFALSPHLPFRVQTLMWIVNLGVVYLMAEPERNRAIGSDHLARMRRIVKFAMRDSALLRVLMLTMVVFGLSSFVPVWTIQLYAVESGLPEPWLGPVWAAANFLVAFGSLASHRLEGALGFFPALVLCVALMATGFLGLSLTHQIWGFAFYFAITAMRGLYFPIIHHQEQRLIPSADRASLLSLRSLLFRLSFLVLGPFVGWGVDRAGQHATMGVLAVFFPGAALLLLWLLRREAGGRIS